MVSIRGRGLGMAIAASLMGMTVAASAANTKTIGTTAPSARVLYASLGDTARSPIGWVEFCADNPADCESGRAQPRERSSTARGLFIRVRGAPLIVPRRQRGTLRRAFGSGPEQLQHR